jgi:hypothetical protein
MAMEIDGGWTLTHYLCGGESAQQSQTLQRWHE